MFDRPPYNPHKLGLYSKPIENLNLSADTTKFLLDYGFVSIGNCIDYFIDRRQPGILRQIWVELENTMYGEVTESLKKTEYWSIIDDNDKYWDKVIGNNNS